jgi:hypothetical protein
MAENKGGSGQSGNKSGGNQSNQGGGNQVATKKK